MSTGELEIEVRPNGPLLVSGKVTVRGSNGEVLRETEKCALCRCGYSQNKPFCDGAHAKQGFQAE